MPQATRLAIVTPWFGADLRGGAQQQSWQLAHELVARGYAVDVLTTCSASFTDDWGVNSLAAGTQRLGDLIVRRFKVDKRDRRAFDRVNATLMALRPSDLRRSVSPLGSQDARTFYDNNINSATLHAYLSNRGARYSHFVFLPYLYGPTLFGLPPVADRAYLQPCLHDESYAFLTRVAEVAHAAKGLLFNSEGELEVAARVLGPGILKKSRIVGEGVSEIDPAVPVAARVGGFVPGSERYVLYLGRQDAAKNVPMLVAAFSAFRRRRPASQLKLVLAGERPVSYENATRAIVDLGPVDESAKAALLMQCRALVQPSINESFSRVIYEAWRYGRPVVVNGACLPTQSAVTASGGGYLAESLAEWEEALARIDADTDATLAERGELGRAYAREVASWPAVIDRYERFLELDGPHTSARRRVWQIVAADDTQVRRYADALAVSLRRLCVDVVDATPQSAAPPAGVAVLAHSRAGDPAPIPDTVALLILHAIGPQVELDPIQVTQRAESAATDIESFASTPRGLAALQRAGFRSPELLPICVDPRIWDELPDAPLARRLQDGGHNLIYVGAVTAGARLEDVLVAFLHYLAMEREARLTIVAIGTIDDIAFAGLQHDVERLNLADRVIVSRSLTPAEVHAVFRAADLFISFDEHEDFGEHLVRAMWFDIPLLVLKNAVTSWLVGPAGILITDTSDLLAIAALAQTIVTDRTLRTHIIEAQRVRRAALDESRVAERIARAIDGGSRWEALC